MTILNRDVAGSRDIWVILGESSESKPTVGVPEASIFHELDTGDEYYWKDEWKVKA